MERMTVEKILNDARRKGTYRKGVLLIQREVKKKRPAIIVCGIILFICMFCGMYCWIVGVEAAEDSILYGMAFENMIDRWAHNVYRWNVGGLPSWGVWSIVCYIATVVISSIGVLLGEAAVSFCVAKNCYKWQKWQDLTECCRETYDLIWRDRDSFSEWPVVLGRYINAVYGVGFGILWFLTDGVSGVGELFSLALMACILWCALWLISGLPCAILYWKWMYNSNGERKFKEFWMEIDPEEKAREKARSEEEAAKAAEERRKQKEAIHYQPLSDTSSDTSSSSSIDHDALDAVQKLMEAEYGADWAKDI